MLKQFISIFIYIMKLIIRLNILLLVLSFYTSYSYAQSTLDEVYRMQSDPNTYAVRKTPLPLVIDGKDDEDIWHTTEWMSDYVDIQGSTKTLPYYTTKTKMVWDDTHLYIFALLDEPHIWGDITTFDDIIYHNNDFEIFIKPQPHHSFYYEIEINALHTMMDLLMTKPYRLGGQAIMTWDTKKIKSAVHLNGSINDPTDIDKSWSIEIAIPFKSVHTFGQPAKPKLNSYWQINFSRVQWQHLLDNHGYSRKKDKNNQLLPEQNWVWSPIGLINMHYPERWGYIRFVHQPAATVELPPNHMFQKIAWNIFYLQNMYKKTANKYASSLQTLPGYDKLIKPHTERFSITITCSQYETFYNVKITDKKTNRQTSIDSYGNYNTHDEY